MTDDNGRMAIYDELRTPPKDAIKAIVGGNMKGKSDINPQWRVEKMTAVFGPVGVGWTWEIERLWLEPAANGDVAAFALVHVRWKGADGEWSHAIPGIGGNMFVKNGHVSDECFKMATTDALSVALKSLGMAADVYRGIFDTKYQAETPKAQAQAPASAGQEKRETSEPAPKAPAGPVPLDKAKLTEHVNKLKTLDALDDLWNSPGFQARYKATPNPGEVDAIYRARKMGLGG